MRVFLLIFLSSVLVSGFRVKRNIQFSQPEPLSEYLYGFNVQTFFENKTGSGNKELLEYYRMLGPSVVRFPGGGPSNFYRFDSVSNTLYHPVKKWKIDMNMVVTFFRENRTEVLLAINIYTGTSNEGIALTSFLREKGVKIRGVELGNELYFRRYEMPVNKYISICRKYTETHRVYFPDIPVAVLAAQIGTLKMGGRKDLIPHHEFSSWNQELAKENFYDAITFHWYAGMDACLNRSAVLAEKFKCALADLDVYTDYTIPEMLKHYNKVFGNREIWITEWNYFEPEIAGNTFLHALFIQRFMFAVAASPVKPAVLNYHNITAHTAKKKGYNIISAGEKVQTQTERRYVPHTGFYAFLMMRDVFRKKMKPVSVEVKLNGPVSPYYVNGFADNSRLVVFVANVSGIRSDGGEIEYQGKLFNTRNAEASLILSATSLQASADSLSNADCFYKEQKGPGSGQIYPISISRFDFIL